MKTIVFENVNGTEEVVGIINSSQPPLFTDDRYIYRHVSNKAARRYNSQYQKQHGYHLNDILFLMDEDNAANDEMIIINKEPIRADSCNEQILE
jgi:hypothetical protein